MTVPLTQPAAQAAPGLPQATYGNRFSGPELSEQDFDRIAAVAHKAAGLAIGPGKSAMVRTRLAQRLRALNLPSFEAYCAYLDTEGGAAEIGMLVSALTTNVSHFFREAHHFEILRREVLPTLVERARTGGRVRIWSAGCANGQEPYSIAMTMMEAGMPFDRDVRVLASDIDPNVIRHAREATFPETMLSGLPDTTRARFFDALRVTDDPGWRATDALRSSVNFRVLNLLEDPWPMRGRFDAIFCRNVVIYFDAETQERLWTRLADQLMPGAWLFIGHSERLSGPIRTRFKRRGITAYQRVSQSLAPPRRKTHCTKGSESWRCETSCGSWSSMTCRRAAASSPKRSMNAASARSKARPTA